MTTGLLTSSLKLRIVPSSTVKVWVIRLRLTKWVTNSPPLANITSLDPAHSGACGGVPFALPRAFTYTENVQLRTARLCLDCEEIHADQQCPVCSSEAFGYVTRWVPADERRVRRLPSATKVTPEKTTIARWVQRGVVGLAVVAASRWWWLSNSGTGASERAKGPPKNRVE